ncbi:MAG: type II toxin-antitoxin system VapC family toxin [Candidatus Polarisedimenticolaceae bacterium]|nr:type II toxin-antitoxin system VapC family toxin [Candidatus Polarisedimenticolaceae bacterium]
MTQRYLLDTHCWLWWNALPEQLSQQALDTITQGDNDILFSVISAWEISIKHALGKLKLPVEPSKYIPSRLAANRMTALPVQLEHMLRVNQLPHHHRDPFDRLLIVQAQNDNLTIITADSLFNAYDVSIVWGGRGGGGSS